MNASLQSIVVVVIVFVFVTPQAQVNTKLAIHICLCRCICICICLTLDQNEYQAFQPGAGRAFGFSHWDRRLHSVDPRLVMVMMVIIKYCIVKGITTAPRFFLLPK